MEQKHHLAGCLFSLFFPLQSFATWPWQWSRSRDDCLQNTSRSAAEGSKKQATRVAPGVLVALFLVAGLISEGKVQVVFPKFVDSSFNLAT